MSFNLFATSSTKKEHYGILKLNTSHNRPIVECSIRSPLSGQRTKSPQHKRNDDIKFLSGLCQIINLLSLRVFSSGGTTIARLFQFPMYCPCLLSYYHNLYARGQELSMFPVYCRSSPTTCGFQFLLRDCFDTTFQNTLTR